MLTKDEIVDELGSIGRRWLECLEKNGGHPDEDTSHMSYKDYDELRADFGEDLLWLAQAVAEMERS